MKLVAVLAAVLLVVHADFYVNLYYEPTQKYLSVINYGGVGGISYLKEAKSSPDYFTKFKFVTSGLPDGQVAIQNNPGTYYLCRDSRNFIRLILQTTAYMITRLHGVQMTSAAAASP